MISTKGLKALYLYMQMHNNNKEVLKLREGTQEELEGIEYW